MRWGVLSDFGVGSESRIGKPTENEVNLSSISLGSVGSEMNYFLIDFMREIKQSHRYLK